MHKNRFLFTIIFDKKNRYIAWTGNSEDRSILKNLDGMSRKYLTWIKQQIEKIATDLITKFNVDDVIPVIKQAFEDLDYGRFDPKDMQFTEQLDKSPNQYPNDKALESSLVATAIIKFVELKKEEEGEQQWIGTSSKLLYDLQQVAEKINIDTRSRMWPKAPNILSRRLNEIVTNLREVGINRERPIDTTTNTTLIEIRKVSPESLESPESDNQAQNQLKNTGDTAGDTNTVARQVSPEENSQNQAQNEYSGDTGYTGDILHTSPPPIYRLGHSDTFACEKCNLTGDIWFMRRHICRG